MNQNFVFPEVADGVCRFVRQTDRVALWEFHNGKIPESQRLASSCHVQQCGKFEHMVLVGKKNLHWRDYSEFKRRLLGLNEGEYYDLPNEKNDARSILKFRCALQSGIVTHFLIRSLPSGGIRVIKYGDYYQPIQEFQAAFPILDVRQAAPCHSLRPGAFFLGLMWNTSLHSKDVQKRPCISRACVMPSTAKNGLCNYHNHFFDYKMSLHGRHVDAEDIYGDDKHAPNFYVTWFWKHQRERFKVEHKGYSAWEKLEQSFKERQAIRDRETCREKRPYDSREGAIEVADSMKKSGKPLIGDPAYLCPSCKRWHVGNKWQNHVEVPRIGRVDMGASAPGLQRGVAGLHRGKKKHSIAKGVKASQKKKWASAVANRVGNKRSAHDPERKWTRSQLEAEADRLLALVDEVNSSESLTPKADHIIHMAENSRPVFTRAFQKHLDLADARDSERDDWYERNRAIEELRSQQEEFEQLFEGAE